MIRDRGSFGKDSAVASTIRVFPDPVGPRNRKFPTGRPTGDRPQMSLVSSHDLVNGFILSNNQVTEFVLQILCLPSRLGGIE